MKKFRKACRSFLALLLALITLIPAQPVSAAGTKDKSSLNSGTHWGENLPTEGSDQVYSSDTGWHRMVLEYGSWFTSNSLDSEGCYVSTTSNGVFTGVNYYDQSASLYRYDEYSEDGMYSLYVKYAGKAWNGEDCYFIAPCDKGGNRMDSLWALECVWDMNVDDVTIRGVKVNEDKNITNWGTYNDPSIIAEMADDEVHGLTVRALSYGILPTFTLKTFTFTELAKSDCSCKIAKTIVPLYDGLDSGKNYVSAEYKDSHKWIIKKNTDGSWAIRSAGTIGDWDWTDTNGALSKADLWKEGSWTTEEVLREALAHYARLLAYQTIPTSEYSGINNLSEDLRKWVGVYYNLFNAQIVGRTKKMRELDFWDGGTQVEMRVSMIDNWRLAQRTVDFLQYESFGSAAAALPFIGMLFLAEYAKNVYITGSYKRNDVYMKGNNDKNIFTGSTGAVDTKDAKLYASYGMKITSTLTFWAVQDLYAAVHSDWANKSHKSIAMGRYWWQPTSCSWAVYSEITNTASDGTKTAKTNQQIRDSLGYKFEGNWTPTKDDGAFWGLYVGSAVETNEIAAGKSTYEISANESAVLGRADSDDDGVCNGIGLIGTLGIEKYRSTKSKSALGPWVTIKKGGVLQIDGPTFAAVGTTLQVEGTLIISPGASLSTEMYAEALKPDYGLSLLIKGGSVIIGSGAVLDLGIGTVSVSDGGELINNGVFSHRSSAGNACGKIYFDGGTLENGATGWMICSSSPRWKQYQSLLKTANAPNANISDILGWYKKFEDTQVEGYVASPFETGGSTANVYMEFSNTHGANTFRNTGKAILPGAIKGVSKRSGTENSGLILNGGTFYRLDYLYTNLASKTDQFSFDKTKAVLAKSGKSITDDPSIRQYLAYTGLSYTGGMSLPDDKADTKAKQANIFALCVGTGSQGTDKISGIVVNYVDRFGTERKETIAPTSLTKTYDLVKNWEYCGTEENVKGDARLINYDDKPLSDGQALTRMEPMTTVTYLFQTVTPLSYVTSIVIVGSGKAAWTCTELSVYRVSYLYPLEEYGYYSKDWYVPFRGSLIAEAELKRDSTGVKSETFAWDNEQISIGTDYYRLNVYDIPDDAPNSVASKTSSGGFTYYNVVEGSKLYSTATEEYTISVELADVTNAGIESLYNVGTDVSLYSVLNNVSGFKKLKEDVQLNLKLSYIDTNGSVRSATLPLIPSAMVWTYWNLADTDKKTPIHGLFQQGETMSFGGTLPDYERGLEANITYSDKASVGGVAISSITVSRPPYRNAYVEDGVVKVDYVDSAVDFYTSTSTAGTIVDQGSDMTVQLRKWNGTEKLSPKAGGSKYLVVVETDSMESAATTRDIQASFRYKTVSGAVSSTSAFSLENAVNDYYGYWLNTSGTDDRVAYKIMSSPGNSMSFVIEAVNLYEFESATFSIAASSTTATDTSNDDDWQLKSVKIYELSELGERKALLGQGDTVGTVTTNRTYFRENIYGKRGCINSANGPMMVKPGESKTISFESGEIGGGSVSGEVVTGNKATKAQRLSYEEAVQDFGFNTRRVMYTITVKVDGSPINSVEDGDNGSKNQFYFQLVFEDEDGKTHTSPCVLANQQLQSDGFRTGQKEIFNIYTNDDYGTPVRVNVIPDDTSSTSDVFDKLKIEYIHVSRTSNTGVDLNWETEKNAVGWIDIAYREDAEQQNGRTNDELIRSFNLQKTGYNVKLEFGITVGNGYVNNKQFVGKVLADIVYLDSNGSKQTLPNVDVVSAIAQYANRVSELSATASNANATSVADYMFMDGHTNRFQLTFDDISSLVSIKLKITQDDGNLKVEKIFARQVFGDGTLAYNRFNEYERQYTKKPNDLTSTNNPKAVTVKSGVVSTFNFTSGNSVLISETDEESGVTVTKGTSEGQNDQLSMTLELSESNEIAAGSVLPVKIIYKNIYGDAYYVERNLVFDSTSGKFMIPQNDLPVTTDIAMPYQIEVGGGSFSGRQLICAKLYILRNSLVIDTFTFAPATTTLLDSEQTVVVALSETDMDAYAMRKGYSSEKETVYLQLGAQTKKMLLSSAKDMTVALVYTEKDDPYGYEHSSDPVSISDCGYTVVESGSILVVPMQVANVGKVKGVKLCTTADGMEVNVAKGCISMEEISNLTGATLTTGWVNLPNASGMAGKSGVQMNSDGAALTDAMSAANSVSPLKISTQFAEIGRNDAYFRLTVCYLDNTNAVQYVTIDKLASEWNLANPWVLVDGLKSVLYYTLGAHDADANNTARLTLNSMELGWYSSTGVFTSDSYTGSKIITEDADTGYALMPTSLTGTVSKADGTQSATLEGNLSSASRTEYTTLKLSKSDSKTLSLQASLPGYPGQLEAVMVNGITNEVVSGTTLISASADSLSMSYTLPVNFSAQTIRYTLTVRAKSFPEIYSATIYVDVEPSDVAEVLVFTSDTKGVETFCNQYTLIRGTTVLDRVMMSVPVYSSIVIYYRTNTTEEITFEHRPMNPKAPVSQASITYSEHCTVSGYAGEWNKMVITMLWASGLEEYYTHDGYVYLSTAGYNESPWIYYKILS